MAPHAKALTEQFYSWECRGRGWFISDNPVELEPVFEPFWRHFVTNEIIDDGKVTSWWQSLFRSEQVPSIEPAEEQVWAFPDTAIPRFTVFSVTLPKTGKHSIEHLEQVYTLLLSQGCTMSGEIVASDERIAIQWTCRESEELFVYTQLRAYFPEVHIQHQRRHVVFHDPKRESPVHG